MTGQRLYRRIAKEILKLIDSGAYPPGTRLPGERALADQFGVSRVVIREAEISLEAIGRVQIKVGSGVYVKDGVAEQFGWLRDVSAFDLTQARLLFESESAALAAKVITDAQLEELQETVDRMETDPAEAPGGEDADREFHMLIAKATGNATNVMVIENLWRMRTEVESVREIYSAVCHQDSSKRVSEHLEILNALRERNPEKARAAMRQHFARLLESLLDASEAKAIEDAKQNSLLNRKRYLAKAI